jgi:bacterioferritin (cytochrome b1)
MQEYTLKDDGYDYVNHPSHYNNYDHEVIEMICRIWGPEETAIFCKINAFKYRMRMGTKPNASIEEDLEKEKNYLKWYKEYKAISKNAADYVNTIGK